MRHGQHHLNNEIFMVWCKNVPAHMLPDGPMMKLVAMLIKERLSQDDLATFTTKNSWLEKLLKNT